MKFPGLTNLKGVPRHVKLFGFDVETVGNKNKFYMCSIVGDGYKKVFYSRKALIKELTSNRIFKASYLIATNLEFDFLASFPDEWDQFVMLRRPSLMFAVTYISYDAKDHTFYKNVDKKDRSNYYKIQFIDTFNFYQASVEKLGNIIELPKLKITELGIRPKTKKAKQELETYNIRDSNISKEWTEFFQDKIQKLGGKLKITISSTALDLYKRKYMPTWIRQPPKEVIDFEFKGYYGGRTEAFKRGLFKAKDIGNIYYYDVNSLYPSVMQKRFPMPDKRVHVQDKISADDIKYFEGMADIDLYCPDMTIPFLPDRTDKLRFPTGNISGYYDFTSIRYALSLGYKIRAIRKGVIYKDTFYPFKKYVDDLYKARWVYKNKKDPTELVIKLLMNSLYGKFGYKYTDVTTIINQKELGKLYNDKKIDINELNDMFTSSLDGGKHFTYKVKDPTPPLYVIPILSIYIASFARIKMHQLMNRFPEDIIYTDTDSIITTRKYHTSNTLGELKLEDVIKELVVIKPKFYAYINNKGKASIRVKGVGRKIKTMTEFLEKLIIKQEVKYTKFSKFAESLRRGIPFNSKLEIIKHISIEDDKRKWQEKFNPNMAQCSKPLTI